MFQVGTFNHGIPSPMTKGSVAVVLVSKGYMNPKSLFWPRLVYIALLFLASNGVIIQNLSIFSSLTQAFKHSLFLSHPVAHTSSG